MSETTLQIRVPTPLLHYGLEQSEIERRITEWLVLSLFIEGRVSSGKAAELLDISRVEFLELLHRRGIAYLDYTFEELNEEIEAVKNLHVESKE